MQKRRLTLAVAFLLAVYMATPAWAQSNTLIRVVVEAAHGGKDPGSKAGSVYEKDLMLAYAKTLAELGPTMGVDVVLARSADELVPLNERANIAGKNKADAYIILHANADNSSLTHGTEIFTGKNNRQMDNRILGKFIGAELYNFGKLTVNGVNINDTHTKSLDNIVVPATLINIGYMSNSNDLTLMQNSENRTQWCKQLLKALVQYQQYQQSAH